MRELIRPTLLMVARLGLFFALVAWVTGQWWIPVIDAGELGGHGTICFWKDGWAVSNRGLGRRVSQWLDIGRADEPIPFHWVLWASEPIDTMREIAEPEPIVETRMFGVRYGRHKMSWALAVRHWLVVTIFALFYGVLKWVYRKRGKPEPE